MSDRTNNNPLPKRTIGDHGIIGNLDTAALVASDGAIDFLCWPHLDSPSIFAALLDPDKGGEFEIMPKLSCTHTMQFYVPDTNVLVTRWLADEGSAELMDLMPHPDAKGSMQNCLVRRIRVTRGAVSFHVRCRPRFDYARIIPQAGESGGEIYFRSERGPYLRLTGSIPLQAGDGQASCEFILQPGQAAWFVLHDASAEFERPGDADIAESIERTIQAWRQWIGRSTYSGHWREHVERSALALKLLTSAEHGSIAAAATFGLPEATGAGRNWDYRATWIRDASFTVYAFMRLGFVEEAKQFQRWVGHRIMEIEDGASLRIMYALDGSEAADETVLEHLAGYGNSRPVRIGNAAHRQSQLDIYGELFDSSYLANKYGDAISHEGWQQLCDIAAYVCDHWRDADAGIWEIRDEPRAFLHSRLMCWVALDRAFRLAEKRSLPAPRARWANERDRISADIWANFRHPKHGYFVQTQGGTELDAALLMMPLVRFVSATDPVWLATLDAIRDQLADDGLIYRYRNADGLEGGEGAFTTCTFWYIECLARAGRLDAARLTMAKGLRYANRLGLFSEEMSRLAEPLGNFPQALTHLAFISAAYFLDRRLSHPDGGTWQP